MCQSEFGERAAALVKKGESVLATHQPNRPGVVGFPTLDAGAFAEWRTQSLSFLTELLGSDHPYVTNYAESVQRGFRSSAKAGIGILKAVQEDLSAGVIRSERSSAPTDVLGRVTHLCDRFHIAARQLRSRHADRATLDVSDEFDVQDLLHVLLRVDFDDVRAEEYAPSYAGKASRLDFLLKRERVVVECKKSGPALGAKELGTQLIEDIARYSTHPDCHTLVCFAYDPEGRIANPRGIEADLSRVDSDPRVVVLVRP